MKWGKLYSHEFSVQFEDVDFQKVVHHPNYLKYCERARVHAMEDEGYSFLQMLEGGYGLVVCDARLRYLNPLYFGQKFFVCTKIFAVSGASFRVRQAIHRGGEASTSRLAATEMEDWDALRELNCLVDLSLVHVDATTSLPKPFHQKFLDLLGTKLIAEQFSEVDRQQKLKKLLRPEAVRIS